jgi:citrate synthase
LIIVNVMGELVNARTAAERLGVDVRTLYAYVSRGALVRVPGPDGRSSRYDSDELDLLARRSRPRTRPRPAASIDLVIATRVSTVTDGMVRYRGTNVLDLVAAEAPFERVADLLWQAGPPGSDPRWRLPDTGERPGFPIPDEIPVLRRFAIAVAATATDVTATDVTAADTATADLIAAGLTGLPTPDWPACGRRVIGCLIDTSGSRSRNRDHANHAVRAKAAPSVDHAEGALPADHADCRDHVARPDDDATVARRLWLRWSPLPPTAARVRALNIALVLLAEHELALSTLSVRVAASARATPASCLLAGLSTLSGSLHGGAARTVHDKLAAGEPVVTGFGHPVHRHGDPRVTPLLGAVYAVATDEDRAQIETARRQASRPLNVDFALGALTYAARMPAEAAGAIFAIARVAGWIAHAAEEYEEPPLRFRGRAVRPARSGPVSAVG